MVITIKLGLIHLAQESLSVLFHPLIRCAGLCCYEGRGGLCSIRLSAPLLKLRPRKDLVQTLLVIVFDMCLSSHCFRISSGLTVPKSCIVVIHLYI